MQTQKIPTVSYVDLNRYIGKWYEIARLENFLEKDCGFEDNGPVANYDFTPKADIFVLNTCFKLTNGQLKETYGKASVINGTSNAQLYVNFIPGLKRLSGDIIRMLSSKGNYWILKLVEPTNGGEYELAFVGSENRKNLWLLSRAKSVTRDVLDEFLEFGIKNDFNMDEIVIVRSPVVV